MKAMCIHGYGPAEVFRLEELPDPEPGKGEVLVEVHASSVNPVDWKMRAGDYRGVLRFRMPRVLGLDLSGVVRAVGPGVDRFRIGDEVYGSPHHRLQGTYAELARVRARELAKKPPCLTHAEAASLPLVFLTAWQSLVEAARIERGQRALIHAGAGGVGSIAIQIAKHLGAEVFTTASERNEELVKSLGADHVIDYRRQAFEEVAGDLDVVLDSLGYETIRRARKVMRRGGHIVSLTPEVAPRVERWGPVLGFAVLGLDMLGMMAGARIVDGCKIHFVTRRPDGAQLDTLRELCEAGTIRPLIDSTYPLEALAEAHRKSESGRAKGKIVITVR